ncbi:predicted protein [Nematostella vectensis]|uniref:TNF receptor-associated factor 4 n=1 Tax=Nematostella vectensis TaxID=45351 RepID=A7SX76_NEMVE|nr:predicted protein [Nematostella vectensis]|eukprot:XP_001623790.1 predicted protein [Nematostella vectensis]
MASCGSNTGEGFNPEQFETPPSPELMCGICLMVVNKPVLTYCGHSFCNFCFNKWRNGKDVVTCPVDYKQLETNQFMADKKTERQVLSLCVKCMNGPCSWKGELRDKKKHLTKCGHEVIKCVFDGCDTRLARNSMEKHEETCEWKIVTCEFCDVPYPKREEETVKHRGDCPLAILPCKFSDIGCTFEGRQHAHVAHCENAVQAHLDMACGTIRDNNKEIRKNNKKIRGNNKEIETLHKELNTANQTIRELKGKMAKLIGTFVWRICDYKDLYGEIYSPSFYTSKYGYKVQLKANLRTNPFNGGTHLSLYACIMVGEYDALLEWPFRRKITLYVIDQSDQRKHETLLINPDDVLPDRKKCFHRPITGNNVGYGLTRFLSLEELTSGGFIKDGVMFIKAVVE